MKEKRKHIRFNVGDIYVTAFSTSKDDFKVIDISEGGIAFYSDKDFDLGKFIDICTSLSDICLGAEIVNTNQLSTEKANSVYQYRIGCKFQPWVSNKRISQLIEGFKSDE